MNTIDLLVLKLQRDGGGSVTVYYPIEELIPQYKLLHARRFSEDHPWPEIEVKDIDCNTISFKIDGLAEEEFPAFVVDLDTPFILEVEGVGEMTFTLEPPLDDDDEQPDDDGRFDAWA